MKKSIQILLIAILLIYPAIQIIAQESANCNTVTVDNVIKGDVFFNYGSTANAFTPEVRANVTIGQPVVGSSFSQEIIGGFGYWSRFLLAPQEPIVYASEGDLEDRIQIDWELDPLSPSASNGYKLYRDGTLLATLDGQTQSYIDFNVIAGKFYDYEVAGINSFGVGLSGHTLGFLNPNGVVTGQVKTINGNPVSDAIITLDPTLGSSISFDGDDMAFVSYEPYLSSGAFTFSSWIKMGENPAMDTAGIVDLGSHIGKNWWIHSLSIDTMQGLRFGFGRAIGDITELDYMLPESTKNEWHHVAMSYSGTAFLFFVDGNLVGSSADQIVRDSMPIFFGRNSEGTTYFHGNIDEVRLYNRQVPQTELQMFKNRTVSTNTNGIIAYWKFDEGVGSKAFDQIEPKSTAYFCGNEWSSDFPDIVNSGITDETGFYEIAGINYGAGQTFVATPNKAFHFNQSLEFSRANKDYVRLTDFGLSDTATISITIKSFDFGNGSQILLSKSDSLGNRTFGLFINNAGAIRCVAGSGPDQTMGSLDTGFQQLTMRIYRNGTSATIEMYKEAEFQDSKNFNNLPADWAGTEWMLGARADVPNISAQFFTGLIDEVAFYDTILTLQEMQVAVDTGTSVIHPNLTNYFNLNEGSGTEVTDMRSTLSTKGTIHGALWSTDAKIEKSLAHEFGPSSRLVTLNPSNTSVDQIDFQDQSTVTVSGFVRYSGTDCFKKQVEILVDGESQSPKIFTNAEGIFTADFEPGRSVSLSPKFEDHTFIPAFLELNNLSAPVGGIQFNDQTTRTILVEMSGGDCKNSIIENNNQVRVTIQTRNQCYIQARFLPASTGRLVFSGIPADSVTVAVTQFPNPDISEYFETKSVDLDLKLKNDTVDFRYYAPAIVEIDSFPLNVCGEMVLQQGRSSSSPRASTRIRVYEPYTGNNGEQKCYLDSAMLTITNNISDFPPFDTLMVDAEFQYEFLPGTPNLTAPHTKSLEVKADVNDLLDVKSIFAIVEGEKALVNTYATKTPEMPFLVLHDPPGDASYSYWEEENTFCRKFEITVSDANGVGAEFKASVGPDLEIGFGFGFWSETPFDIVAEETGDLLYTTGITSADAQEVCITTKTRISTSDDEIIVGEQGADVFVGAAMNLIYGETKVLYYNDSAHVCAVKDSSNWIFNIPSFETTFNYSEFEIVNDVIPTLQTLADAGDTEAGFSVGLWEDILAENALVKDQLIAEENISFDALVSREYSYTRDSSTTWSHEFKVEMEETFLTQLGLFIGGVGAAGGPKFKVTGSVSNQQSGESSRSITTGYLLADNDPGDNFSVDILNDENYQTPAFRLRASETSCPWEIGSQPRQTTQLSSNPPSTIVNVPYNGAAVFELTLSNISESGEDQAYTLGMAPESNGSGAVVKANGAPLIEFVYVIPFGETQNVVLTVERNPGTDTVIYNDLEIALYSQCEKDRADGLGIPPDPTFYSAVFLDVHFLEPCSPIDIFIPQDDWVHTPEDTNILQIYLSDYNEMDPELIEIIPQYRRTQGDGAWLPIGQPIPKASLNQSTTLVQWSTNGLNDGLYEIRAVSICTGGLNKGISHVRKGKIERTAPELFGFPEPSDGVLSAGDEISITFTEPIRCDLLNGQDNVYLLNTQTGNVVPSEFTCVGNKIIIKPLVANQTIENLILRAVADTISDLALNKLDHTQWEFFVDQNPIRWQASSLTEVKFEDEYKEYTRIVANTGGATMHFNLTNIPEWVEVFPRMGDLAPGQQQAITFVFSNTLFAGSYQDTIIMQGAFGNEPLPIDMRVVCRSPEWEVNPADFENNMNFTVELSIEEDNSKDRQDIVAAFVDNELRGVAYVEYVPAFDRYEAFLTVFANEVNNDTIDFQIWDASACLLYGDIIERFAYAIDGNEGNPVTPTTLHTNNRLLSNIPINAGWNWLSFNLAFPDPTLDEALSGLSHPQNDKIKGPDANNQVQFSDYLGEPVNGWIGGLAEVNNRSRFLYKADTADILRMVGQSIDPSTNPIAVEQGWNRIGYLPLRPTAINEALASLQPILLNGDIIKSQTEFAQYVSSAGWIGSLEFLAAPNGYMMSIQNAAGGTITYPANNFIGPSDPPTKRFNLKTRNAGWQVNPGQFEHTMTLVGMIDRDGENATLEDYTLGAFVNEEVRGVANSIYIDALDIRLFFLTIYANEDAEEMSFKIYNELTSEEITLNELYTFGINEQHGSVESPTPFTFDDISTSTKKIVQENRLVVQPNPFRGQTMIHFLSNNEAAELMITDLNGKVVEANEMQAFTEWAQFRWAASDLARGIYIVHVKTSERLYTEKVIIH